MSKTANLIFIIGLLVAVFFFATYDLTESPHTWYDEGAIIQRAITYLRYGTMHYQVAPDQFSSAAFDSTGYPVIYPIALAFKYFGIGLLPARAVMAVFILLLVLTAYTLIKRTAGSYYAAAAALLLGTFPPLYGNGKNVLGEIPGLFFLFLFLFCLHFLEKSGFRSRRFLVLSGLAAGLCLSTKPNFLLFLPALVIALLIFKKKEVWNWDVARYFLPAFMLPLILFAYTQFLPTDSLAKVLAFYRNPYNLTDWPALMLKNFLRFFTEATPIYFWSFFLTWLASLALRMKSDKNQISLSESTAFIFASILFLAYLRTPGWYRYFFIAHVLALVYFPFSFFHLFTKFIRFFSQRGKFYSSLMLLVLFMSIHLYLLGFNSWVSAYYGHTTTQNLESYFKDFNPSLSVFVYDVPQILTFLPNKNYYQYLSMNDTGLYEIGTEQISVIDQGVPDILILSADEENLERFAHYHLKDRVGGYLILIRR
ncbi:MAG: hypothetical protein A3I89_01280 [Candidatus Harrisonbacteria bacterium RIFCSPLOWO2_02_FULL_41_11]|uniref:Glycosyltransferase RgtA/B/C/D-like domain-containing protein n=1 Tax=Candidatus Harrisonbacteria bacterium RIFCSPHIGHO2_02_FULL_42_16 TaxID=1798404 RepID=A0A1G1ZIC2_9BACT|nr:MAG: hypothetical protein A3B92_00770 [Candidatus Harrisonbacteria bacterium RIFCSPHIGHO2_02_FULL_42_16]OGY67603.1 MAG: hypothetical protein A3I89_01280 [Candidatus Harrisonbacteria bacterium RIFCSPLOWO2_02_FULL_41_11]